jgi:hypothetical protein
LRAALGVRDAALAAWRDHDEVVLWFEHDLYGQLQLFQVLDRLAREGAPAPGTALSLVTLSEHPAHPCFIGLGQLAPEELPPLLDARTPVGGEELALGTRGWATLTASEPSALEALAREEHSELPYLAPALRRLLEEYPGVGDGLGRTEREALEAVAAGAERPARSSASCRTARRRRSWATPRCGAASPRSPTGRPRCSPRARRRCPGRSTRRSPVRSSR